MWTHALGQPVRQASTLMHERGHASPRIVNREHCLVKRWQCKIPLAACHYQCGLIVLLLVWRVTTLLILILSVVWCAVGLVQLMQYYYQCGSLYRLRALGERRTMDITVGVLNLAPLYRFAGSTVGSVCCSI